MAITIHSLATTSPLISHRELNLQNPERDFLWRLPDRQHFTVHSNDGCIGLGRLCPSVVAPLSVFYQQLVEKTGEKEALFSSDSQTLLHQLLFDTELLFN